MGVGGGEGRETFFLQNGRGVSFNIVLMQDTYIYAILKGKAKCYHIFKW